MFRSAIFIGAACAGCLAVSALAQDRGGIAGAGIPNLSSTRVASGLTSPVYVTAPPGDFNRLFILEQKSGATGRVRVLDLTTNPPTLSPTVYLSVTVSTGDEQGLLGLTFHPDFANNGYFFIYYTTAASNIVARYRANEPYATSGTAVATGTTLLTVADPFSNHNGGWIAFGPDGYMYVAMGDGGSANDPNGNGQNINALLGKMLRIDVDGADNIPGNDDDDGDLGDSSTGGTTNPASNPFVGVAGSDSIWAYGLRNPWRSSFDRLTGELYIADVGQNAWEEIDVQPANDPDTIPGEDGYQGGRNYGWRCMEGNHCTGLAGCTCELNCGSEVLVCPAHEYSHSSGCSITGGYVYRGSAIPELQGTYFFSDFCNATMWTFTYDGDPGQVVSNRTAELAPGDSQAINFVTSFGEDAAGELYVCDRGNNAGTGTAGEIFKIVLEPANNACASALHVTEGSYPFTTIGATTDGVADATNCSFNSYTNVGKDIWYDYTASCTDVVTISVCDANYNSKIAVYSGAACPGATPSIACNDDFCGTGSQVTINAVQGQHYRIRVGGFQIAVGNISTGNGTLVISCPPRGCSGNEECDDGDPCNGDETCVKGECQPGTIVDCNGNQISDACDISSGFSLDANLNGIPDECEPPRCTEASQCDDGDPCNGVETCVKGECQPGSIIDCNGNSISDACDISSGSSLDKNLNGVPDECDPPPPPCPADLTGNGEVDVDDLLQLINAWDATSGPEDLTGNGLVDVDDLLLLINAWGPCPTA